MFIVIQILLSGVSLCDLLFGVFSDVGYVDVIAELGWAGIDWSLWPFALAEVMSPVLLMAANLWLLWRFFARHRTFPFSFISVLAMTALLNLVLATLYQVMLGDVPRADGSALVFGLGAFQYLLVAPRAKAAFRAG